MLLTCDIGNTNIKAGIFTEDKLTDFIFLRGIEELASLVKTNKFSNIVVSSVVPSISKDLIKNLNQLNITPIIINKDSSFNLEIDYKSPGTLGTDRICSAEGAYYLYSRTNDFKKDQIIISIDLGTATTLNIVKYPGIFIGGIIAPGTDIMLKSLKNDTAQLPEVSIADYNDIIGKSTNEAIASGVMHSAAGLIERAINLIKSDTKAKEVIVYITGGNFGNVKKFLEFDYIYEKGLVLYGIKAIYNKSKELNPHP
ncbi:MAG: type III pantothenate kinase [Ignavibacteriaceae bacterium]|nr:type III pantothenate kinase [Ignavibacteriaceae bacterium]